MSRSARLFEQFHPEHYDLSLSIDKESLTFSGSVVISGNKVGRPSKRITFHQEGLNFTDAVVTKHDKKGDKTISIDRLNPHKKFHEVRIHSKELIYPGNYTIEINFDGKISNSMVGMYPSTFNYKGEKKTIIATQFESHHARSAFPCIDEPEAKATFKLSLSTPSTDVVLSNTLPEKETVSGKTRTTIFKQTPRMSSYLLAFISGEIHSVESKTKDGILVRSWGSIAQPKKALEYSVHEAVNVLDFFSEYFQTHYPLEKCDQVALPDFDAGAMENWGLITYREIAMLTDPTNRSITTEQFVSLVISHELSHQWFGNLVTMKWWDDLWLNESFASIMEHLAMDELHPDWQQWEAYVSSDVLSATSRDIYKDIQPVGVEVNDPEIIETLFDPSIVYAKGGRLLKMLREYIGDDSFRQGLKSYFDKLAYKNSTREDLWQYMSASSGKDIHALMTPWLTQPGLPLVTVKREDNDYLLTQEHFVIDAQDSKIIWPVPLLANGDAEPNILSSRTAIVKSKAESLRLNKHASGHYLVHYADEADQKILLESFSNQKISAEARIDLVNTLHLLARRGDTSITEALELISSAPSEPRDSVWSLIVRVIGASSQLTEGDESSRSAIKKLKVRLASAQYKKLGWDDHANDDSNTKQLRHTMLALMLGGEDKDAIMEALSRYNAKKTASIPAEIRASILGVAVRFGPKSVISELIKAYPDSSSDMQLDIASALTSTKIPELAREIIDKAISKDGFVRDQDTIRWLAMFLRNYYTRDIAWEWMESNWDRLYATLGGGKAFDDIPTYCASVISTVEGQTRYKKFFEPKREIKVLQKNINIGLSDIESRVAWRGRDEQKIKAWLKDQSKSS